MLSFKSAIDKKVSDTSMLYNCNTCKKQKNNKIWAIYYNESKKCDVNVCSYLCYNIEEKENNNVWKNLKNKEDFNFLYPIITPKKEKFVIKSEQEIYEMNKLDRTKYYNNLDHFYDNDPIRAVLLYNIQNNMDCQDNIENNLETFSNSDDDPIDDY